MQKRFKINVNGHAYDVVVEEVTDDAGGLYPDHETMRGAAPLLSQVAGVSSTPTTAGQTASGQTGAAPRAAAAPGDVVSPLAGVVHSIDVALGSEVTPGARVATLEAKKTKTMVAAGISGRVQAIAVSAGDAVEAGQCLLTIA